MKGVQTGSNGFYFGSWTEDMCEFEPRGSWPKSAPISQLVFIGRKLEREKWRKLFEKCGRSEWTLKGFERILKGEIE